MSKAENTINKYLQEFDLDRGEKELIIASWITLMRTAIMVAATIWFIVSLVHQCIVNVKYSNKVKNILKDGKDWKVYIVNDPIPNAFCVATPRIFVTSGLIKKLSEREIIAVCLHEAGHIHHNHSVKNVIGMNVVSGLLIKLLFVVSHESAEIATALAFGIFLIIRLGLDQHLARVVMGRQQEYNADSYAVKYGYGDELKSGLIKLYKYIDKKRGKCTTAFCSAFRKLGEMLDEHPTLQRRIENILKKKEIWKQQNPKKLAKMILSDLKGNSNLKGNSKNVNSFDTDINNIFKNIK